MFKKHSRNKHYWFTIQSPNGQTLATSETYTTAAMRDKGIEAVKRVVFVSMTSRDVTKASMGRPSDTFYIENAKGKVTKR